MELLTKFATLFVAICFSSHSFAAVYSEAESNIGKHIKTVTSTNNSFVYLKKIGSKITPESYQEIKNILNQSKSKNYQAKKVSKNAIKIKFTGNRWVRFTFDVKNHRTLIGTKTFTWDPKKKIQLNLKNMYSIINAEYPAKKSASLFNFLIPEAHAFSFGNDSAPVAVAGTSIGLQPSLGLEGFLTTVEKNCDNHPLRNPSYMENDNRGQLKVDFDFAKQDVQNGAYHAYGLWVNENLIGRFERVQRCLLERRIITETDLLPIAVNPTDPNRGTFIDR